MRYLEGTIGSYHRFVEDLADFVERRIEPLTDHLQEPASDQEQPSLVLDAERILGSMPGPLFADDHDLVGADGFSWGLRIYWE